MIKIILLLLLISNCKNDPYILPTVTIHNTNNVWIDKLTYNPKGLDYYHFKLYVQSKADYDVFVNLLAHDFSGKDIKYFETGKVKKGRSTYELTVLVGPNHEIDYFVITISEIIDNPHEI